MFLVVTAAAAAIDAEKLGGSQSKEKTIPNPTLLELNSKLN